MTAVPTLAAASFSENMGKAIHLYAENFSAFFWVSCAAVMPSLLKNLLATPVAEDLSFGRMILEPLVFCLHVFLAMCFTLTVIDHARGEPRPLREVLVFVLERVLRGIGAYLSFAFIVFLGVVLLVVPGAYCFVIFFFFLFAMLGEDKGLIDSFKRSHELVKDRLWMVFCFHLGIFLLIAALAVCLVVGMRMLGFGSKAGVVVMAFVSAFSMPVITGFYYFVFEELKALKDGVVHITVKSS